MSRPIDADELIEKIRKLPNAGIRWFVSAEAVFDIILNAPPIEPERKKGKWIIDRGLYKCSCCKQLWVEWWAVSKPIERMNKEMPYCPMCGADMRGES